MVARLRNDRRARVRLYWSVIGVVAAVGLAYAAFIFAFGGKVVLRLFGPSLGSRGESAQGAVHLRNPAGDTGGRAKLSDRARKTGTLSSSWPAIRAVVLAIAIYPLTALHGPTGAAAAGVLSILLALPIMAYLLQQTD